MKSTLAYNEELITRNKTERHYLGWLMIRPALWDARDGMEYTHFGGHQNQIIFIVLTALLDRSRKDLDILDIAGELATLGELAHAGGVITLAHCLDGPFKPESFLKDQEFLLNGGENAKTPRNQNQEP